MMSTDPTARALLVLLADLDRDGSLVVRTVYRYRTAASASLARAFAAWREAGYPIEPEPEPEPVAPSKRLVWVEAWPDWHLCPPDRLDWLLAPYSAWRDRAAAYAHLGAGRDRCVDADDHAASAALCAELAREDGYEPDPWPGEGTP